MPESAGDFYTKSRAQHAGATANHRPVNNIGFACPKCERNDQIKDIPIAVVTGKRNVAFQCRRGHEFADNDEIMNMEPTKIPVAQAQARQEGHEEVRIQIPSSLRQQLQDRFGDKLAATLAGILSNLVEPNTFMINSMDMRRISELMGEDIKSTQQLVGTVYERKQTMDQLNQRLTKLTAGRAEPKAVAPTADISQGQLLISVPNEMDKILELAKYRESSPEDVVESVVKMAIERDWA